MWRGRRVFISGGTGVIGTALVHKLLEEGAELFVGDLQPMPSAWAGRLRYRQGDLNYITSAELEAFGPEVFFHLAATFERSTETYEFWSENQTHNVDLSHHLMTCLKDCSALKKVVFASSYLIYDPMQYSFAAPAEEIQPLKESSPIRPRNMCGAAKLLHEIELEFLNHWKTGQYTTVCARIYRSYGKNSRDIISRWIRALLNGEPLKVYRKEGLFDYVYAEDVAEGLLRMAACEEATGIINLGTGRGRRVSEVVDVLRRHFPTLQAEEIESDIPYEASQADMERCERILGWKPTRMLEDTIPEMIAFEKAKAGQADALDFGDAAALHVLVTSISKKVPLLKAVRRAMAALGFPGTLHGGDVDARCIGKHFVDRFWEMPRLQELPIEAFAAYCREHNIRAVIPTRDGELAYFAEHRALLAAQGIQVMVSESETVRLCLDKLEFARKLQESGLPAIATYLTLPSSGATSFVVKERYGAGAERIGLKLAAEEALSHAIGLEAPIFQPYIEGQEYSIDCYVDRRSEVKGLVARTRDTVVGGESQVTTTVRHEALESICREAAQRLGLYGHAVFQAIVDAEGTCHLIECNCRFGGASRLSLEAGLDTFYWFLLEASGVSLDTYPFVRSAQEKMLVRHAEDLIVCR